MDFAPVIVRRQSLLAPSRVTPEAKRWGSFRSLVKEQMPAAVTGVAFSPRLPYELAAAADMTVAIVNSTAGEVRKTIGRFKDTAHSPDFKPDGKLLVAGSDDGVVQVFDLSGRAILRQFKGHNGPVWTSKFSLDGLRILSGSDDTTVRMWDLPTGKEMLSLTDAKDYVRAQAQSPSSKHVWGIGSYDRRARIYDLRDKSVICTLDHGEQVDDMVILPGGLRAVTVGGKHVKVWDLLNSGRLEYKISTHAKAVTCCAVHPTLDQFITAGLDGQLKVLDLTTFKVLAAVYYQEAICSLAISPDGKRIGTGSLEGVAEIRVAKAFNKNLPPAGTDGGLKQKSFEGWGSGFVKSAPRSQKPGTRRFFERGAYAKPDEDDEVLGVETTSTKQAYDRYLRSFSYGLALAAAAQTDDAGVLASVVEELAARKALRNAMTSCSFRGLENLLRIIERSVDLPRYSRKMVDLMNIVVDTRAADFTEGNKLCELLANILKKVEKEVATLRDLQTVAGYLESVNSVANLNGR